MQKNCKKKCKENTKKNAKKSKEDAIEKRFVRGLIISRKLQKLQNLIWNLF